MERKALQMLSSNKDSTPMERGTIAITHVKIGKQILVSPYSISQPKSRYAQATPTVKNCISYSSR